MTKFFFDTNVLVYAFLDVEKRARALEALADGGIISVQVLNEFTNVAIKKRGRSWPEVEAALAVIRARFPEVTPLTADLHAQAVAIARDEQISFYDALIVAAASAAGCAILCSEDLQTGRKFGAMTVENPFAFRPTP